MTQSRIHFVPILCAVQRTSRPFDVRVPPTHFENFHVSLNLVSSVFAKCVQYYRLRADRFITKMLAIIMNKSEIIYVHL